ncbi:hypothetical protein C7293_12805 [filamentous cyanobacterium CCT1]|nr:hypothetical protein C7293_12805 [filamentous cyanobacterium CCT1]PSN80013.1 hypothetical protein C8B47_08725 [filamentous cyanobacterium CCP4]
MMAISLKELADCIGVSTTGNVSVLRNLLGFFRGQLPPDPTGVPVRVSLLRQARLLQGRHLHLNVIAVGVDNFDDNDDIEIDYSIYRIRDIYAQVNIGVGRVEHYGVPTAEASGFDSPTTSDQLEQITDTWSVPNNGIDVFIPFNMNVCSDTGCTLGRSAIGGPCEEKNDKGMNGAVTGLWGSEQTSRTFAHEIGHYLNLEHNHDGSPDCPDTADGCNNLMAQTRCANSCGGGVRAAILLTRGQGNTMDNHCLARFECS